MIRVVSTDNQYNEDAEKSRLQGAVNVFLYVPSAGPRGIGGPAKGTYSFAYKGLSETRTLYRQNKMVGKKEVFLPSFSYSSHFLSSAGYSYLSRCW